MPIYKVGTFDIWPGLSAEERFLLRIEPDEQSGCILWVGTRNQKGYGAIRVNGRNVKAHNYAWERVNGPVPEGLILDHLCRNPSCVNPAHLEPVTERENTLRGVSVVALNASKTHCNQGHPFDEKNTGYSITCGRRTRYCKECKRICNRKRKANRGR